MVATSLSQTSLGSQEQDTKAGLMFLPHPQLPTSYPRPRVPPCMHKINMPASAIRTAQGECKGAVAGKMSPHMYAPPQKLQARLGAECSSFGQAAFPFRPSHPPPLHPLQFFNYFDMAEWARRVFCLAAMQFFFIAHTNNAVTFVEN